MTKTIFLTLLIAGILTVGSLATNEAYAAVDMFLKIDGIEGESTDAGHEGEIEILSYDWGETNEGKAHAGGGGGGPGKVSLQDFNFAMIFEKSSPKLMQACAEGKHIPEAILTVRKAGFAAGSEPDPYLTITLTEILISSYQTGDSGEPDTVPVDHVSLNFEKIKFEYQPDTSEPPVEGSASKHGRA